MCAIYGKMESLKLIFFMSRNCWTRTLNVSIFLWLLCMELQWGCQTNRRNSYSKYDLKNVHMGLSSGAVIESIGSMHVCRERVSTVQKNSLHRASFHYPLPLPILYNSIFDTFSKLVVLSLRPDLKNVYMACYSSMFNKSMFKI